MIAPTVIIPPWIGAGLPGAYPNKTEGRCIAEDLARQVSDYLAADPSHRETMRHMLGVHRGETEEMVSGAEGFLFGLAWGSLRLSFNDTLIAVRKLTWDPGRIWTTPSVVRDFWVLVRTIEKQKPSYFLTSNPGRRELAGIFDRGGYDFLEAVYRKYE